MAATATKRDPAKWAAAKSRAKAKMGGKHSARAMQLAVKYYKGSGGTYSGPKRKSPVTSCLSGASRTGEQSLASRLRRDLKLPVSGTCPRKQDRRYRAKSMRQRLEAKRKDTKAGKQFSSQPKRLLTRPSSTGQQKMVGFLPRETIEVVALLWQIEERRQGTLDV